MVAGIDGIAPASVDGGGLVSPHVGAEAERLGSWSIDWWVGADDRWHLPAREPSVRQRRIGHGPVIETSLRVPSGDVIQTVYPVMVGGRTLTVMEISNQSPVPVALAIAIRPYGTDGRGTTGSTARLELVGDTQVTVDGRPLLWLPRKPNEAGAADDRDLFEDVTAGQQLSWGQGATGLSANAVCLYPLPHRTELRFVIGPLSAAAGSAVSPDQLPDPEAAARGWNAVIDRAARFEFPEPGISALAGAARARLVMAGTRLANEIATTPPGAGSILAGLAAGGHTQECRWSMQALAESFPARLPSSAIDGADVVAGAAVAAELLGDDGLNQNLIEVLAQLTHLIERDGDPAAVATAKLGLARMARTVGQGDAAAELLAQTDPRLANLDLFGRGQPTIDEVVMHAEAAAPARRWSGESLAIDGGARPASDSPVEAARFWLAVRALLIREGEASSGPADRSGSAGRAIELLPDFPTAWRGGEVEVHEAPVAGVHVSFAVRWHGYRPALLWEVTGPTAPGSSAAGPVTLRCPGLDPDWITTEPKGEALLAGSATDLPDAPAAGESFS